MYSQLFILASAFLCLASGHGYIRDPPPRHALFLKPELGTQPPYDWNYTGVECGDQDATYSTCGRCGSESQWGDTRRYNQGGEFDKGIVVATYQSGAVIEIKADMTAGHYGHWEVELCPQATETDSCFQKLQILEGSSEVRDRNRICVGDGDHEMRVMVKLPDGIRCERCTIRWTYRTSYPPHGEEYGRDMCDNPHPTQVFRNCADVKIV